MSDLLNAGLLTWKRLFSSFGKVVYESAFRCAIIYIVSLLSAFDLIQNYRGCFQYGIDIDLMSML